ncbi:MAG: DsbA family oxidoreductase [Ilyomonas sp.]
MRNKMKVEIWSDIMCPFCYIGKRKFEAALAQFADKDNVELEWKSYQLSPDVATNPEKNIHHYLAEHKGISLEQATAMNTQVAAMAKQVGLEYNFDRAIPANTMKAHQFAHFAKQYGKQNEAEEILFRSYFTDGKNIDDINTLLQLGNEISLDANELKAALEAGSFEDEVRADIYEAFQIGVRGVPFFVFDRKYAVSGAQDSRAFLHTVETAFDEWRKANETVKLVEVMEGRSCDANGNCN